MDSLSLFNLFPSFLLSFQPLDLTGSPQPSNLISQHQYSSILLCNVFACLSLFIFQIIHFYAFSCLNILVIGTLLPQILLVILGLQKRKIDLALLSTFAFTHSFGFLLSKSCDTVLLAAFYLAIIPGLTYILKPSAKIYTLSVLLCIFQAIYYSYRIEQKFHGLYIEEQSLEIKLFTNGFPFLITFVSVFFYCQQILQDKFWQAFQKYQQKLNRISSELDQINLSQDAFISSISHETRNPLNFIHCTLECLLDHVKDSHFLPLLLDAKRNSLLLLNLINNALDAAKLTSNKLEIFSLETNPADVIFKALKLYSLEFKNKKISLRLLIDQSLPSIIRTDETRILQILHNLLSNALNATPQHGNITLYATWISHKSHQNDLLTPIKPPEKTNKESVYTYEEPLQEQISATYAATTSQFDEFDRQETQSNLKKLKYLQTARINSLTKNNSQEVSLNGKSYFEYYPNLFQQTPPPSPLPNPHKFSEDNNGYLKIQITDTGCGIKPENMPKVFGKFNRVRETEGIGCGVGLGLWISKQICERMGGEIGLYSEAKKGSSVVFYIRVKSGLNF